MYAGRDFPVIEDGASRILGYDLSATLSQDEIITAVSAQLRLTSGRDDALALDPVARFFGAASFLGNAVTQGVSFADATNMLAGNVDEFGLVAATSLNQVIASWARISLAAGHGYPQTPPAGPPSSARIIILPDAAPKFVLPTLGGYAEQDFPTSDQGEARFYGFDLNAALTVGEEIVSARFALSVKEGTDSLITNDPQAYFSGMPVVASGVAQQLIAWPPPLLFLTGNTYVLNIVALTTFNQAIEAWSRITIDRYFMAIPLPPPLGNFRITEAGDIRSTMAGDLRIWT